MKLNTKDQNVWFTSDTHFGHENIIKYCNRPFSNVHEMNESIISRWNEKVNNNDVIYHLGDFAFGDGSKRPDLILKRLNGKKILISGNHDSKRTLEAGWDGVFQLLEIAVNGQVITLCHYSMNVWHHSYRGNWHLYGHSHGGLVEGSSLSCDVGVDVWNLYPVSFDQLKLKMDYKKELIKGTTSLEVSSNHISSNRVEICNLNSRFYK